MFVTKLGNTRLEEDEIIQVRSLYEENDLNKHFYVMVW